MPPLPIRLGVRPPHMLWGGLKWLLALCSALASLVLVSLLERGGGV